jgi:RNA recognition motif-containing protein
MAHKLFVGGLSFTTSSERLREVFAAVGQVESATVVTDRATGQSRGFGFVEMETPEGAREAVQRLNNQDLDGRRIKVEVAKPSERGGPGGGGGRREPPRGGGGGRPSRW